MSNTIDEGANVPIVAVTDAIARAGAVPGGRYGVTASYYTLLLFQGST